MKQVQTQRVLVLKGAKFFFRRRRQSNLAPDRLLLLGSRAFVSFWDELHWVARQNIQPTNQITRSAYSCVHRIHIKSTRHP